MRVNPGGTLAPGQVIGRDRLIGNLWDILERQSVVLGAERRMGKTSVIQKMQRESPPGQLAIYRDLETVASPAEFTAIVFRDVEDYLSRSNKTAQRVRQFLDELGGVQISGFQLPAIAAPHWKKLLVSTVEDLLGHQQRQVVFFWDEVPYMLQKMGQEEATEVLDMLRSLRQSQPNLRMVFTGSIGLHHVIDAFRTESYANAPTNDMYKMDVPPLELADAKWLACQLLEGERIEIGGVGVDGVAEAIAEVVDCIPFYIHHTVAGLKVLRRPIDRADAIAVVETALTDDLGQWDLEHYRQRVDTYYRDERQRLYVLNCLDVLAVAGELLNLSRILELVSLQLGEQVDRELMLDTLRLLKRDYYVKQEGSQYRFRYGLIQQYWRLARGLGE